MSTIKWFPLDELNLDSDLKKRQVGPDDIISITMTESGGHRVYYRVREDEGFCGDSPYTPEEQKLFDLSAAGRVYEDFLADMRTIGGQLDSNDFPAWVESRKRQLRDQHD
jgi:hypothetical protein